MISCDMISRSRGILRKLNQIVDDLEDSAILFGSHSWHLLMAPTAEPQKLFASRTGKDIKLFFAHHSHMDAVVVIGLCLGQPDNLNSTT